MIAVITTIGHIKIIRVRTRLAANGEATLPLAQGVNGFERGLGAEFHGRDRL